MPDPMMLSDTELDLMTRGRCPDCGVGGNESAFTLGPCGAMGQNVACRHCGSEFNAARMDGRYVMGGRNSAPGAPDRERLRDVFGIVLP
jgi:hypothetical protein